MEKLNCKIANQIDLVNYLKILGHEPSKIKNHDYWYLSPLRNEKTPSFKVNQKLNVWYDHGLGKGGNIIDFGIEYFRCTVSEFLQLLNRSGISSNLTLSFKKDYEQQFANHEAANCKRDNHHDKIVIADVRELTDGLLTDYLASRSISQDIAMQHCREVEFCLNNRKHNAVGFANNSGGFELRNEHFKGSSSPKDVTFIDSDSKSLTVFEGFFDFLSYKMLNQNKNSIETSFLILNSLSFFNKSLKIMEKHEKINLYLDRDPAGIKLTAEALHRDASRYIDQSFLYQDRKDLNEWLKLKGRVKRGHVFKRSL